MMLLNRNNRSLWGYSHQVAGTIIRNTKKRGFFFFILCVNSPPPSLYDETGRPVRFEIRSCAGAAAVALKKAENGDAVSKTEEEHPEREESMNAEFLLSLVFENRFILTCYLYII